MAATRSRVTPDARHDHACFPSPSDPDLPDGGRYGVGRSDAGLMLAKGERACDRQRHRRANGTGQATGSSARTGGETDARIDGAGAGGFRRERRHIARAGAALDR